MPKVLKLIKHLLTYTLTLTYLSVLSWFLFPLSSCTLPIGVHLNIFSKVHTKIFLATASFCIHCGPLVSVKKKRRRTFFPRDFAVLHTVLPLRCSVSAQTVPSLSSCPISLVSLVDKSQTFSYVMVSPSLISILYKTLK